MSAKVSAKLKLINLIALFACILLASFIVFGCERSIDTQNFIGKWEFSHGTQEGLSKEDVEMAKAPGTTAFLILEDDGTGSLDLYGDVSSLTWTATSETAGTITVAGSNAASMEIEDEELILSGSSDRTLTFVRPSEASDE